MAQITWMNVPIPDIGSTNQQGIRTAADLFNTATRGAQAGIAGIQDLMQAQQVARVQAADRYTLEQMLSVQDSRQYAQMWADGSLLGPAAGLVSSATLQAAEARGGQLAASEREARDRAELAAAEAVWDRAVPFATHDPAQFQDIMKEAHFSNALKGVEFAERGRKLYVDPGPERVGARKEAMDRASADLADRIIARGAMNPDEQVSVLQGEQDPLVRQGALDILNKRGEDTKRIYSTSIATNDPVGPQIVEDSGDTMYRHFGNNLQLGTAAAGPNNPPPGSPEWSLKNRGRQVTQGDMVTWGDTYVKPASRAERGPGKETTAVGPYQVTNTTRQKIIKNYGKQLFGTDDMNEILYTPENEEKIAKKIYQTEKAGAWQATQNYKGLKDLKAFEGRSWEDAKPLLRYIDGGIAPPSHEKRVKQIESILQSAEKELPEGARVILNAEEGSSWGLNEAASELSKSIGKEGRPGDAREVIEGVVRDAREAGNPISYAEAVGLIKNSMSTDGWTSFSDLSDNLDLEDSKLKRTTADIGNARVAAKSYKSDMADLKKLQELSEKYKLDKEAARSQLARAKSSAGGGTSAINAFRKWQDTSERLTDLIAKKGQIGQSKDFELPFLSPFPGNREPGTPDIDLMLEPDSGPIRWDNFLKR